MIECDTSYRREDALTKPILLSFYPLAYCTAQGVDVALGFLFKKHPVLMAQYQETGFVLLLNCQAQYNSLRTTSGL